MIAHLRFYGWALLIMLIIYIIDAMIAWTDVWIETDSRKKMGGLHKGEYLMHIILSVLVGAYMFSIAQAVYPDITALSSIAIQPPAVPYILRLYMTCMGIGAIGFFFYDSWKLFSTPQRQET